MHLIAQSRVFAFVSSAMAAGLLLWFFLSLSVISLILWYVFLPVTVFFSLIFLLSVSRYAKVFPQWQTRLINTRLIVFANLSFVCLCLLLSFCLLNVLRVTFENVSEATLTHIEVSGACHAKIDQLRKGESQTLWMGIEKEGRLLVEYVCGGETKQEEVMGYVTHHMGGTQHHCLTGGGK